MKKKIAALLSAVCLTFVSLGFSVNADQIGGYDVSDNENYIDPYGVVYDGKRERLISCPEDYEKTEFSVPSGVKYIDENAFINCKNLEKVTIPNSVERIGSGAFDGTPLFEDQPENSVYADKWLLFLSGEEAQIRDDTIGIADAAVGNISHICVPESVKYIGEGSLSSTYIRSVKILNPDCSLFDSKSTISNEYVQYDGDSHYGFNGIIYGYRDSTAAKYALKYGMDLAALDSDSGDINGDGGVTSRDMSVMKKVLTEKFELTDAMDVNSDSEVNVFDYVILKRKVMENEIHVGSTEELKAALASARPGNCIVLEPGEYVYSGETPKGHMFTAEADGTEGAPITLTSYAPDPDDTVLSGNGTDSGYGLTITGDWWRIDNISVTNASKGIVLDNSNHTTISFCNVYNIGAEGIHFRDNSSYCSAVGCNIHDTGVVSPGYGEGIYVGSAKSTTEYGHECDHNGIYCCTIGPNVAAEHIDIKEYTTGTVVDGCTFYGKGMSGENYSKSFVNIKGNDCVIKDCVGYREGCDKITRAFEANNVVDGWGQNSTVCGNRVYMDTALNSSGGKMYFLNAWDCSALVGDNYIAYEDGKLRSVDNRDDQWSYYNCNMLTYIE